MWHSAKNAGTKLRNKSGDAFLRSKRILKNAHGALHSSVPAPVSRLVSSALRGIDLCLWSVIKATYNAARKINVRLLLALIVYAAILSTIIAKMRYSAHFQPSVRIVEDIEEQRTQWAKDFIVPYGNELLATDSVATSADHHIELCIAVPTAERRHSFLLQTVATVVRSIVRADNSDVVLIVNDVNKRRMGHTDPYVAYLEQHGVNVIRSSLCLKKGVTCRSKEKAVLDMATSVDACLTMTSAPYIVLLEDDMVVSAHLIDRVLQAAKKLSAGEEPWAFLSLFRTGHYDGFSRSWASISELLSVSMAITAILTALVYAIAGLQRVTSSASPSTTSTATVAVAAATTTSTATATGPRRGERVLRFLMRFVGFTMAIAASIYVLGRQNTLLPLYLNEGLYEDISSASTAGLVFPRRSAEKFTAWLQNPILDVDKSQAAVEFAAAHGLKSYLMRPNPVEHVGRFTSIAAKRMKREIADPRLHFANFMKVSEWFEEDDFKVSLRFPRDINPANRQSSKDGDPGRFIQANVRGSVSGDVHYVKTTKLARAVGLLFVASSIFLIMLISHFDTSRVIANENALTAWSKPTLMSLGFNVDSLDETADELAAPRICIVMTTAERKIPYSYAAAATVLRSLIESKEDGAFIVNDVGFYKDRKRPGVDLLELSGVQVVRRRGCDYSKRGASRCSRHVKAKLDYIESLKACLDTTSARYVTVIDDDVVVSKRFVQRQLLAADALQENALPWTLLRLFRTDAYDNFSLASPTSLLELVLFSAANSFLWIFILGKPFWTVQTWSAELRHLFISRAFTFFSLSALSLLVFGRQNTFAPFGIHSGVFKSPSEAGSVGIMYPRQIADALVDFLQNGKGPSAVDEAINDFCGQYHKNAPCLVLRPNLMEHVGRFSSLSSRRTILENTRLQLHFASGMRTSEWFISDDTSLQDKFEAKRAKATESLDSPLFVSALDNVNQILADTGGLARQPLIFIISSIALINIVGFGEHFFIPVSRKHMRNILRAMRPPRPPMRSV
ncbi:Hypothetical Protein FCC1311_071182 [Hondaea fermentalgiana]|uniref:Uncharacterized protein n=1 Tax=Hondaea fermentalgiana TaxID=2315210 RepID=A0A2R5GJ29_9STRA|nr:Hypothetical Protein FCC1311_071182 [Hondaea fermentalgiana]|eukprot:GBG30897.1 Hypothetical Protein FCC1311_071182 [Hondaea fermentalgiana]